VYSFDSFIGNYCSS